MGISIVPTISREERREKAFEILKIIVKALYEGNVNSDTTNEDMVTIAYGVVDELVKQGEENG
jgi:hypothetical protein